MSFGNFSYTATVIIFAVTACLIEWVLGHHKLKKYMKLIGVGIFLGIIYTLITEPIALKWRTWVYSPEKIFNIYIFGAALETIIFTVFVGIAIASATLAWSDFEEDGKPLIKTTFEEIKKKITGKQTK